MAWETRTRGGLYYTRSVRDGRRVRREYVGAAGSPTAELVAAEDAMQREAKERALAGRRAEAERLAALDAPVIGLGVFSDALLAAALVVGGYRQHDRGEWRKRRGHAG